MVSIIIFAGSALFSLNIVKLPLLSTVGATIYGTSKKKKLYERELKIGGNPMLRSLRLVEEYESFTLLEEDLPKELSFLAHEWILTPQEQKILISSIVRFNQRMNIGDDGRAIRELCFKHGVDFRELGRLVLGGPDIQQVFKELSFFSNNRMQDPLLKSLFAANQKTA